MTRSYLGYVSSQTTSVLPVAGAYGVATGGTSSSITVNGETYTLLTFTSSSTLTVTKAGVFDVLAIAGGAGGGSNPNSDVYTGGGGGGGVLETQVTFSTDQTIVIGSGGAAFKDGNISRVGAASWSSTSLVAVGGGAGCLNIPDTGFQFNLPIKGGSGGGGIGIATVLQYTGATGIQGNNGGNGVATLGQAGGGGGGGGAVGSNGSGTVGGNGGQGYDASAFRGEAAGTTRYAGGGGGGGASGGTGGAGGGGNRATAGSTNTGGGGGGNTATNNNTGAAGGSGIVLVRFKV